MLFWLQLPIACIKGYATIAHLHRRASGADSPLLCDVATKSPVLYEAKSEMPQHLSMEDTVVPFHGKSISGSLVRLEGITHFVTDFWPDEKDFYNMLETIMETVHDKAIGIIPYRHVKDQTYDIRPFVYVTETGSASFERACGSGSLPWVFIWPITRRKIHSVFSRLAGPFIQKLAARTMSQPMFRSRVKGLFICRSDVILVAIVALAKMFVPKKEDIFLTSSFAFLL